MLRLESVSFAGVRSFEGSAYVEFPPDGSMLIRGLYKGSPAASGSGKSTVVMAVAYCLDLSAPPATELKCKTAENFFVEVKLKDDSGKAIYVRRDPKLRVTIDGVASTGSSASEILRKIMIFSKDVADAICYRRQDQPGSFLCMADASKKEFLSSMLGLDEVEVAAEKMNSRVLTLTESVKQAKQLVEQLAVRSGTAASYTDAQVSDAEQEVRRAAADLQAASAADQNQAATRQKIATMRAEAQKLNAQVTAAAALPKEKERIKVTVLSTQADIRSLLERKCPTCSQKWDNGREKIPELEKRMSEMGRRFQDIVHEEKMALVAAEKHRDLVPAIDKLSAEASVSIAAIESTRRALDDKKRILSSLLVNQEQAAKATKFLDSKKAELLTAEKEQRINAAAAGLIGRQGFLGDVFDEVLSAISAGVNDLMAGIPNVSRFSVSVSSQQQSKVGSSKKSISVTFYEGEHQFSLSSLSGGQRNAVDLCFDVAIAKEVRRRSGRGIGWFIMDEAMDGLDAYTKQCALDLVRQHLGGQIIVIDHATEVQEGFASVVTIEFDGRTSRVV